MIEGEGKEGFFKKLVLDVTGVVKERIIGKYFSEMKGCYGKMLILNWKELKKDSWYRFSWQMFLVSLVELLCLYEFVSYDTHEGRHEDGNDALHRIEDTDSCRQSD